MKKHSLLFCLIFIITVLQAQHPYVRTENAKFLYYGVDNPITVYGGDDVYAEFVGCRVRALGKGKYLVKPTSAMVQAKIICGKEVATEVFNVLHTPVPSVWVGDGIIGGKVSAEELLENPVLNAGYADNIFNLAWRVKSFRLVISSRGMEGAPMAYTGGRFNEQVISNIKNASPGTIIIFQDIVVYEDEMGIEQKLDDEVVVIIEEKKSPVSIATIMPEFPGGMEELTKFLQENVAYPIEARAAGEQGVVGVQFIVEGNGSISNAKVIISVSPALDEEALRVVRMMPRWTPGYENGKPVRVSYRIPITFAL